MGEWDKGNGQKAKTKVVHEKENEVWENRRQADSKAIYNIMVRKSKIGKEILMEECYFT